jgi:hypothetical protein
MEQGSARMHIDSAGRQYTTVGGERRAYTCYPLRRSFRDEHGRPRKETLANLSALPDDAITALPKILKGATLVDAEETFQTERSIPHGDVAAAHVMAVKLGLRTLLGPACAERGDRLCADPLPCGAAGIKIVHRGLVGGLRPDSASSAGS